MVLVNKTLEYRRALFLDDSQNLEKLVREAWSKFPTQAERTVTFGDSRSTCGLRAKDLLGNGFAIHCGRYIDGQGVGTIPTAPAPEVDVGERPPAPGENFLNSDLMAIIRGNHVICMNCGRNAGSLRIYCQQLFRLAGFDDDARQFELTRIGSPDKVAIIETLGVKSVDLMVGISDATLFDVKDHEDGYWSSIKSSFSGAFRAITDRDDTVEQLRSAEKGTVKITINVPNGDVAEAKDGLDGFAGELVEDEDADDFVINLRDGSTIKPREISVRKQVKLDASANSVSVLQAWNAIDEFMCELEDNGQLEA